MPNTTIVKMPGNVKESRIGVLMPVYNSGPFLREAIESILAQTYKDFDFYIINDGSTDNSEEIILSFNDDRIKYLKNDKNRGLVYSLNRGLDIIQNEFIARMDSDDIALPQRFERQIEFMDANPDIVASGSHIEYFGKVSDTGISPLTDNELRAKMIMAHGIVHPTAIYRSKFIQQNNIRYHEDYYFIEDYHFWLNVSKKGKLGNINEVLLKYRWDGQNITSKNWDTREERYKLIYEIVLDELEIKPSEENKQIHLELAFNSQKIGSIRRIREHLNHILNQNKKLKIYPHDLLKKELTRAWQKLFFKVAQNGFKEVLVYWWLSRKIKFTQFKFAMSKLIKRK